MWSADFFCTDELSCSLTEKKYPVALEPCMRAHECETERGLPIEANNLHIKK
jgi:hypothetical protein